VRQEPVANLPDPSRLKHYEIVSRIGAGGMGVVYRARDTRLGRTVALKMLHSELAHDDERSRRFEREARIVSALSHPGIATLYDFDRDGETVFLTMELIDGPTLRERLATGSLGIEEAFDCAIQVAEALAAAHTAGVVHRDLKPENVMRARSGYYKVLDFGVARARDDEGAGTTHLETRSWSTSAGALMGTVSYMSPEQALGHVVDLRSDVFAFGVLLYEILTGNVPFRGANVVATADAILHAQPAPLTQYRKDVPAALERIVEHCLQKEPERRYADAGAIVADLKAAREGREIAPYPARPKRRRAIVLGASAIVSAVALSLALWAFLGRGDRSVAPPAPPPPAEDTRSAAVAVERPRVLVAHFENPGGAEEIEWLRAGLAEMLTTDLARTGGLEVIATQRLRDLAETAGDDVEALDRSSVTELAKWAGASVVITGAVFKVGSTYRIDAQAFDTETGTVRVGHTVEGREVLPLVQELTSGLRRGLAAAPAVYDPGTVAALPPTRDPEAFRLYARAKERHERLDLDGEIGDLRQAIERDPAFDVAKLDLTLALLAEGDRSGAAQLVDELQSRGSNLHEGDRLLADALHALYREGDLETGSETLDELSRRFSLPPAAYFAWAQALENPLDSARTLRVAIETDPDNLLAIAALAARLRQLGDSNAAAAILDDAARRHPDRAEALRKLAERID
jgi:eukaryotic-like serine/threonine-protein kinase